MYFKICCTILNQYGQDKEFEKYGGCGDLKIVVIIINLSTFVIFKNVPSIV